ncbi:S1 family peptidase [Prescottella subtropica]|uniref:S1 family peptidase n=1 Tax=Prescottella subtropica TaxID=2545757 RepID=UPI001F4F1483|nr:S1 family peptidase [Prescottella subtropica]
MTTSVLAATVAAAATLAPALTVTQVASAAPAGTGIVSNGIAWTAHPDAGPANPLSMPDYCTLGAVGTDTLGNKIAISAGHCVSAVAGGATEYPDGATVYRFGASGTEDPIGTIAYRDPHVDYVVITLNPNAVLSATGPDVRLDGIGTPTLDGTLCKAGARTGVTCGPILAQAATRIASAVAANGGDSGGPAYIDGGRLVGMVRGPFEFIDFAAVLASIAAQPNPIGQGFTVTP